MNYEMLFKKGCLAVGFLGLAAYVLKEDEDKEKLEVKQHSSIKTYYPKKRKNRKIIKVIPPVSMINEEVIQMGEPIPESEDSELISDSESEEIKSSKNN